MDKRPMYLLTYDHGGFILWGDRVQARLEKITGWLEKYPKLRIGLDYEAFTFDEMPQITALVRNLLARFPGRVGLGSTTYGQPLSLFLSEESNVRQLTFAVRTNLHHFGVTPPLYAVSEFAFHNQLPQLLRDCGYAGVLFRTHVMNYGYQKSFDSAYGFWRGKDGTQIPAIPTYAGAGEGYTNCTVDNWILTRWPDESQYAPEDFEQMFSDYTPLLASRYDDISNGTEELVAAVQRTDNWQFVLLEDLPAIYGEPEKDLPTDDNDFHGRMPWGYCGNEIFNGVRRAETKAVLSEHMNALSVLQGGASMHMQMTAAWQNVLVAEHHDVTICGLLDEAHRFIGESERLSDAVCADSLQALVRADGEQKNLLVCNPHAFPVSGWIETGQYSALASPGIPTEQRDGQTRLYVTLPPLTRQVFALEPGAQQPDSVIRYDAQSGTLTTPQYTFVLTRSGIASIADTKTGTPVTANGSNALLQGWIDDVPCGSDGIWQIRIYAHSVKASYTGRVGSIPFRFTMETDEFSARIDCTVRFDLDGERVGRVGVTKGIHTAYVVNGSVHENKLRMVLDLCLDSSRRMVRDLPFAIADWDDQIPQPEDFWYAGKKVLVDHRVSHEECLRNACYLQGVYWLALRDASQGFAVLNKGCMGSAVEGNRLSVPLIYANDYMCGTRMLHGSFENRFALLRVPPQWTDVRLHKAALEYVYPLVSSMAKDKPYTFTWCEPGEATPGVILTALYAQEDAVFARFCNYAHTDGVFTLQPRHWHVDAETDLLGREKQTLDSARLTFRPWEVKTVRLRRDSADSIRET